jgi:hypothetical protein
MTKKDPANCLCIDKLESGKSVLKVKFPENSIKVLKSPGDVLKMPATKDNLSKRFAVIDKDLADFLENKLN